MNDERLDLEKNVEEELISSTCTIELAFPMKKLALSISVKEDVALDDIQLFILQCIEKKHDLKAICEITLFTDSVIQQLFEQLEISGFLEKNNDEYILSDIAERYIQHHNWILQMNSCKDDFIMDMVTGDIVKSDSCEFQEDTKLPKAKQYIDSFDVESLNLAENVEFIKKSFDVLSTIEQSELEIFLNNIIISAKTQDDHSLWKPVNIKNVSEWPIKQSQKEEDAIYIRMHLNESDFSLHDTRFEGNSDLISALKTVRETNDMYLSDYGKEYLKEYSEFEQKNHDISVQISPITNQIRLTTESVFNELNVYPIADLYFQNIEDDIIIQKAGNILGLTNTEYISIKNKRDIPFDIPIKISDIKETINV